jgi:hypothetical protein
MARRACDERDVVAEFPGQVALADHSDRVWTAERLGLVHWEARGLGHPLESLDAEEDELVLERQGIARA